MVEPIRGHEVKTAEQLERGDLAMLLSDAYPHAYHRPVMERRGPNLHGVVAIRWFDKGADTEQPLVNYHREARFDIAKQPKSVH